MASKGNLKKHVKGWHAKEYPAMLADPNVSAETKAWVRSNLEACPICEEAFELNSLKLAHMAEKHPDVYSSSKSNSTNSVPIKCPHCPHIAPSYRAIVRHVKKIHDMD